MQSTGQTSTHAVSLVPTQGSQMIYATKSMISNFLLAAVLACDPGLTARFAPARPRVGRYEVCTSGDNLETVMAADTEAGVHFAPVEQVEALDAFGAGAHDRVKLAQLYRGRRVSVSRGWRQRPGTFESVTLISPYPDASLEQVRAGTMAIRVQLER